MRPGLNSSGLQCWLTLSFRAAPTGSEPNDVSVVFSSVVLEQDESFDWRYIATHDHNMITEKDWLGNDAQKFVPDELTTPDTPPRRGSMHVLFQIPSKERVKLEGGQEPTIEARLYWGGKKQDSISRGLFLAYQSVPGS